MKQLYAPWRSDYTTKTARSKNEHASSNECIFCKLFADTKDAEHFIIKRLKHVVIMLNRYPYNAGHLLVIPLVHKAQLQDLSKAARTELMEALSICTEILRTELNAEGINIGLNEGKAAGAGIPAHLHFHILPRWAGDTNFMPTLAETKQISFDLAVIYKQIKKGFDKAL